VLHSLVTISQTQGISIARKGHVVLHGLAPPICGNDCSWTGICSDLLPATVSSAKEAVGCNLGTGAHDCCHADDAFPMFYAQVPLKRPLQRARPTLHLRWFTLIICDLWGRLSSIQPASFNVASALPSRAFCKRGRN
jgi:hypothetical protein